VKGVSETKPPLCKHFHEAPTSLYLDPSRTSHYFLNTLHFPSHRTQHSLLPQLNQPHLTQPTWSPKTPRFWSQSSSAFTSASSPTSILTRQSANSSQPRHVRSRTHLAPSWASRRRACKPASSCETAWTSRAQSSSQGAGKSLGTELKGVPPHRKEAGTCETEDGRSVITVHL
jgi:hypothetical protein